MLYQYLTLYSTSENNTFKIKIVVNKILNKFKKVYKYN